MSHALAHGRLAETIIIIARIADQEPDTVVQALRGLSPVKNLALLVMRSADLSWATAERVLREIASAADCEGELPVLKNDRFPYGMPAFRRLCKCDYGARRGTASPHGARTSMSRRPAQAFQSAQAWFSSMMAWSRVPETPPRRNGSAPISRFMPQAHCSAGGGPGQMQSMRPTTRAPLVAKYVSRG
jgi:hypothetical protein